ncbi:MAG: response regulator [Candidatus Electryoneaceae bacterium]|nr:response regulator [Candidatus Electryoneaceae bacterium]
MADRKNVVLIVDDDPNIHTKMTGFLSSGGYEVISALNGEEALAFVRKEPPDVILLDVMMPGMYGYEVCRQIKGNKDWNHIPIIMITALGGKKDIIEGFEAGADEFLTKPIDPTELTNRIRSVLNIRSALRMKYRLEVMAENQRIHDELTKFIVHEMKDPLTSLLLYCDILMKRRSTNSETLEFIKRISQQSQRLQSLSSNLILLARMEEGKLTLNREMFNLNELASGVQNNFKQMAKLRQINLVVDISDEPCSMQIDANLFRQVLDNLISNALKYSLAGTTVTLKIETLGTALESEPFAPQIRIKIIDEGSGIPKAISDKLALVRKKEHRQPEFVKGLVFCQIVVEAHNGTLTFQPNKPQGTILVIEL